jgi:malate synthase
VWQWILHQARLEDSQRVVSRSLVVQLTQEVMKELTEVTACQTVR